jgi:hypothetical protein
MRILVHPKSGLSKEKVDFLKNKKKVETRFTTFSPEGDQLGSMSWGPIVTKISRF